MSKLKGTYTFSDVTEGHTISVEFENMVVGRFEYDSRQFPVVKYRIGTSGSFIQVANDQTIDIPLGSTFYFEITEAAGIDISNWQAIFEEDQVSEYESGTGLTGSFDVPSDDFFIRINAVSENYEVGIAASPTAGGTVSPTSLTLPYGTTIVQNASYPSRIYFRLPGTGGEQQASATAKIGYEFDHWSDTSGTITAAKTITAYFTKKSYTTTVKMYTDGAESTTCGTVSVSNTTQSTSGTSVSHVLGDTLVYSATANAGYEFDHWATNPTSSSITSKNNPYTKASAPAANTTMYAVFNKLPTFGLEFETEQAEYGTVSPTSYTVIGSSVTVVADGNNLKINNEVVSTATPKSGYTLAYWIVSEGGTESDLVPGESGNDNITLHDTSLLVAHFVKITYAVTLIATNGHFDDNQKTKTIIVDVGTTYETTTTQIIFSDGQKVLVAPDEGYAVGAIWNPTSSSGITKATTVNVSFNKATYKVQVAVFSGTGGTAKITYKGSTLPTDTASYVSKTIEHGDSVTVTAEPKTGYTFTGWYDATGTKVSSHAIWTFDVLKEDALRARFETTKYTIKASAGSGGSIDPSGDVTVTHGSSKTFTITAYSGHKIKSVKIDKVEIDLDTDPGWKDA